nr:hypothetical protein [Delftia acidovorans]
MFEHDPDLEEPAILFANGDVDGAEQGMLELIDRRDVPAQLPVWLALLDLYRAADRPLQFDKAGIEFAARFGRSAPQWFAMPQQRTAPWCPCRAQRQGVAGAGAHLHRSRRVP